MKFILQFDMFFKVPIDEAILAREQPNRNKRLEITAGEQIGLASRAFHFGLHSLILNKNILSIFLRDMIQILSFG